jgi:hypothetical protein
LFTGNNCSIIAFRIIQPFDKQREKATALGPSRYKNNDEKKNAVMLA